MKNTKFQESCDLHSARAQAPEIGMDGVRKSGDSEEIESGCASVDRQWLTNKQRKHPSKLLAQRILFSSCG